MGSSVYLIMTSNLVAAKSGLRGGMEGRIQRLKAIRVDTWKAHGLEAGGILTGVWSILAPLPRVVLYGKLEWKVNPLYQIALPASPFSYRGPCEIISFQNGAVILPGHFKTPCPPVGNIFDLLRYYSPSLTAPSLPHNQCVIGGTSCMLRTKVEGIRNVMSVEVHILYAAR